MSWGAKAVATANPSDAGSKYDAGYYRDLFERNKAAKNQIPVRMALVGTENTAKTGLAVSIIRQNKPKGRITIFDFDNSATATVGHNFPDDDDIHVIPIYDEADESLFNDDNTVKWHAVIDKVGWFANLLAEDMRQNPEDHAGFVFDGGSTFLKWCEFGMNWMLQNRSKNAINVADGDRFNQAEWRFRNQMFRDIINRMHSLPVQYGMFTFHLKAIKNYVDGGGGSKVLMTIGQRPDWVDGTQRIVNAQIFLNRYMNKPDPAAGVKADKSLSDGEWEIRGVVEEMKGKNMELLGKEFVVLNVKGGKVSWNGIKELQW